MPPKEIVICGGGVGGASLAHALSRSGFAVTLLEKESQQTVGTVSGGETLRSEVVRSLVDLGLMEYFERRNCVIRRGERREVWHWQLGKLGDLMYDNLAPGYPIIQTTHHTIAGAIYESLAANPRVKVMMKAQAIAIGDFHDGRRKVVYRSRDDGQDYELSADLVVVADGANSRLRSILGMKTEFHDYGAGYLIYYLDKPEGLDWGRLWLGQHGFVGLFPTADRLMRAAVEVKIEDVKDWLTAPDGRLKPKLERLAPLLKDCAVRGRGTFYHVIRRHVTTYVLDGVCLLGDAAHTTHPMQAQGISMVFNDIMALNQVLVDNPSGAFTHKVLSTYEAQARGFNSDVLKNNHDLYTTFHRIMEDGRSFQDSLPALIKLGLVPASSGS